MLTACSPLLTLVVGNLGVISALDLGGNTDEASTKGVLGRSVQHLGLDFGLVRGPVGEVTRPEAGMSRRIRRMLSDQPR